MTNYCNPHTYYFSFSVFCVVRYFRLSLLNNFYCDILYLCNIVIPIINLVTSANLKKAGIWPAEIFFWKNKTRCSDQLCSCLWFFNLMPFPWNFGRQTPFKADRAVLTDWNRLLTVKRKNNVSAFHGNERTYATQSRYNSFAKSAKNACFLISISAVVLKLMVNK